MRTSIRKRFELLVYVFAIFGVVIGCYVVASALFGTAVVRQVEAQQDPFLNQRLNQIEQRFTTLENRLNRLEQQGRYPTSSLPNLSESNDVELRLIRTQLETLNLRMAEVECGVAGLDERTLTPIAKQQRKTGTPTDPCRQTPNVPIQLSARPSN
jgi:TolA-binding protein